jgi:hypothetical protein
MKGVMWFLFALLLGIVIGFGASVYVVQSEAGNVLVRRTDVVQDLERRLQGMEQQRDALGRQLEDVAGRASRMEASFMDLEKKFRAISDERNAGAPPAQAPSTTLPPSPAD